MMSYEDEAAMQPRELKKLVDPHMAYLCAAVEIGVLKAFIDWKVFDHIPDNGSISSERLAERIGGEQELLDRTVPLLTAQGILEAPKPDHVAHTERSRSYKTGELGAGTVTHLHNCFIRSMAHFPAYLALHGFGSPKSAQVTPFGMATGHPNGSLYDIIGADDQLSKEFDSYFGRLSKVFPMHGVYDLSWMQKQADVTTKEGRPLFVDIGGSNGHALRDILQDHPWLPAERCAVLDRPTTIEHTRAELDEGIKSIRLVAGNALETLPPPVQGALVYQLRRILNDFPDDDVRRFWKALREAAAPETRVFVVEELLQANCNASHAATQDVGMMLVGGKRRSAQMHGTLAAEAGFRLERTLPETHHDCSVLEFVVA
jgi:hypothetical protein